jgi:DNA repair exonuclease SbcCD ATPase subunit
MEINAVIHEVGMVGDETETEETLFERRFTVGEVVEYWEGTYVRGGRLGSGEPAFVKEVKGNGVYAIKMVGSLRGKFRVVGWKSLFKDGSFNKNVARGDGARVRGKARLEERARLEAEAKLGEELRASKRKLERAGKRLEEQQEYGEERMRMKDKEARDAEKDLTAGHKRQLQKMEEDRSEDMRTLREDEEEKGRNSRKCIRDLRKEVDVLTGQLGREKEGQADLERQLLKSNKKRTTLIGSLDGWKERHADLQQRDVERQERERELHKEMTETARGMKTLGKVVERQDIANKMEVAALQQQKIDLGIQLRKRTEDVKSMEEMRMEVSCCCSVALS